MSYLPPPKFMHRRAAPRILATCALAGAVLVICGASTLAGADENRTAPGTVISTFTSASTGTILVSGTTLYTLSPSKVACTATCLKYWPAVLLPAGTTTIVVGHGASRAQLSTVTLKDGRRQVTFKGKALYRFVNDKKLGQVTGNVTDTWGKWTDVVIVAPSHASPTTTTTSSNGGGGGGIGF